MQLKSLRLAVFFIVLLDVMGFGLIIPSQPFLAQHFGASATTVTLLGATYSLLQLLLAPVWGSFSDRLGRRPILLCTIAMTVAGHATFAASTSLLMLFIARGVAGMGAANISTAQAVLADTHEPSERSRAMALIGAAFGVGFVIGPLLGGLLFQWDDRAPAACGALLGVINLLYVAFMLPETHSTQKTSARHSTALQDLRSLEPRLKKLVLTTLLFITAFSLMEQSIGLFIQELWVNPLEPNRMKQATKLTSFFMVVVGISITIVQGVFVRRWLKVMPELKLFRLGLVTVAASLLLIPCLGWVGSYALFLSSGAFLALGSGMFNPSVAGLVSLASPSDKQGFGLAVNQSAAALGRVLGPTTAGLLFSYNPSAPFLIGSILTLVALGISSLIRPERQSV